MGKLNYVMYYETLTRIKVPIGFDVHHIDLDRSNNAIENLVAIPRKLHNDYHKYRLDIDCFNLDFNLKSSTENGHQSIGFATDQLTLFRKVYDECNAWVDFRNYRLGKHSDFRYLSRKYK